MCNCGVCHLVRTSPSRNLLRKSRKINDKGTLTDVDRLVKVVLKGCAPPDESPYIVFPVKSIVVPEVNATVPEKVGLDKRA